MLARSRVYVSTSGSDGPLGNATVFRKAVPNTRPSVTVPVNRGPSTRPAWNEKPITDPKRALTSDAAARKIMGDPIQQLNRTRNPQRAPGMVGRHPLKKGDMEGIGDKMPIQRESAVSRQRRIFALEGVRREKVASMGPRVTLGTNGSGLEFYKGPRIKPALPGGVAEVPAVTEYAKGRASSLLDLTTPGGTAAQLNTAATMMPLGSTAYPEPAEVVELSPVEVSRASSLPGVGAAKVANNGGHALAWAAVGVIVFLVVLR